MYSNNGNQNKSGYAVKGGGSFKMKDLDMSKVDDFRERIKREEKERKRSQSSSQGSSRGYSHN